MYFADKLYLYSPHKMFAYLILISGLMALDVLQSFLFSVQAVCGVAWQAAHLCLHCASCLPCVPPAFSAGDCLACMLVLHAGNYYFLQ